MLTRLQRLSLSAVVFLTSSVLGCSRNDDSAAGADSAAAPVVSAGPDTVERDTAERPQSWDAPWLDARRRGIDIRALGQEPGWVLEIDLGTSMYLVADYGEKKITTGAPTAVHDALARTMIYEASTPEHRITAVVREGVCHDTMSGQRMTHEVRVTLDGQEYRGCGMDLR